MSQTRSTPTILNYLNYDCFNVLFRYLSIEDIICSERVSQQWQRIVLMYLRSVRICIEGPRDKESKQKDLYNNKCRYTCTLKSLSEAHCSSFERWAHKLGDSVVAVYCTDADSWKIYRENCPNLESIAFGNFNYSLPLSQDNANFKSLRRVWFDNCEWQSEATIRHFLNNTSLETLEIEVNYRMTGACFKNIKSKLKSLVLYYCLDLELQHLQSAVDSFKDLTHLHLMGGLNDRVYDDVSVMLPKMPKLEYLLVHSDHLEDNMNCDGFIECVCQLSCLKDLNVNCRVTDAHLAAVTRCCKELHSLHLGPYPDAVVSGRGVEAVCRNAGERLTSLGISCSWHLTDDDVVTCVRSCPNLECLELTGCRGLTARAPAAADRARAAARPHPPPLVFRSDFDAKDHYQILICCRFPPEPFTEKLMEPFRYLRYKFGYNDDENAHMDAS